MIQRHPRSKHVMTKMCLQVILWSLLILAVFLPSTGSIVSVISAFVISMEMFLVSTPSWEADLMREEQEWLEKRWLSRQSS